MSISEQLQIAAAAGYRVQIEINPKFPEIVSVVVAGQNHTAIKTTRFEQQSPPAVLDVCLARRLAEANHRLAALEKE